MVGHLVVGEWTGPARLDDTGEGGGSYSVRVAEGQRQGDGRGFGTARWASGSNNTQR
jgi:hypothetical protein